MKGLKILKVQVMVDDDAALGDTHKERILVLIKPHHTVGTSREREDRGMDGTQAPYGILVNGCVLIHEEEGEVLGGPEDPLELIPTCQARVLFKHVVSPKDLYQPTNHFAG